MIDHPLIAEQTQTCWACPEQYEGRLLNGLYFYFRYRNGYAGLACGWVYNNVIGGTDVGMNHGDSLQGVFDSPEDRAAVFTQLLIDWNVWAAAREGTR